MLASGGIFVVTFGKRRPGCGAGDGCVRSLLVLARDTYMSPRLKFIKIRLPRARRTRARFRAAPSLHIRTGLKNLLTCSRPFSLSPVDVRPPARLSGSVRCLESAWVVRDDVAFLLKGGPLLAPCAPVVRSLVPCARCPPSPRPTPRPSQGPSTPSRPRRSRRSAASAATRRSSISATTTSALDAECWLLMKSRIMGH